MAVRTRTTPTFWDGLSVDEKKASVDQQHCWAFDNQYAWSPASKVSEKWNTHIYPNIIKPLLKDNDTVIYHKIKKQSPYSVNCWMIGREWHSSHPAAVIICANPKVTRQAVQLVEKHGELFNWGFRVYGFENRVALNMGSPTESLEEELKDTMNICGQLFQVGRAEGKLFSRVATMGGTVIVGGEIYGLTVVHPFLKSYDDGDSSQKEESNIDYDSVGSDLAGNHSDAGNAETIIETGTAHVQSQSQFFKELGSIPRERSFYSLESDWALVRLNTLDENRLLLNPVILKDTVAFPSKASSGPSSRPLWAAVGTGPPVETTASDTKCGLYVPPLGFQDVWALRMVPVPGNCGSWVIDAQDNSIFGVVVAGMEPNISYGLPASQIFEEIKSRFPDMRLPSLGDPETLLAAARLGETQLLEPIQNREGKAALRVAMEKPDAEIIQLLLNHRDNYAGASSGLGNSADSRTPSFSEETQLLREDVAPLNDGQRKGTPPKEMDSPTYHCLLCPQNAYRIHTFKNRGTFKRHVEVSHQPRFIYWCPQGCGIYERRRDKLKMHIVTVHRLLNTDLMEINNACQELPCPTQCLLCSQIVQSWDEFYSCLTNHCEIIDSPIDGKTLQPNPEAGQRSRREQNANKSSETVPESRYKRKWIDNSSSLTLPPLPELQPELEKKLTGEIPTSVPERTPRAEETLPGLLEVTNSMPDEKLRTEMQWYQT